MKCVIRLYFTLFHEPTVCNLLEVLLFHSHVCEKLGDSLIDLVDYCVRKMIQMNSTHPSSSSSVAERSLRG